MTLQEWGLLGTIVVAVSTAIFTGIKTLSDRRAGVRSTEHSERRDTVADRDALIDQMQELRTAADARAAAAETAKTAAEQNADSWRKAYYDEKEYSQILIDHIYRRRDPPPPPRPPK